MNDEDLDLCYECEGYGDDYYVDEKGELSPRCPVCPFFPYKDDLDNWEDQTYG